MSAPHPATPGTPRVLFMCVANSCRSQMAEAIARSIAGTACEIWSSGSRPSGQVHPVAIQMMQELGLDLSRHRSKGLDDLPSGAWDVVVTMGCGDACGLLPAKRRLDWPIPDPVGLGPEQTRAIRDDLAHRVRALLAELGVPPSA